MSTSIRSCRLFKKTSVQILFLTSFLLIFGFFGCKQEEKVPLYNFTQQAISDSAMVVTPHPLSTEVGLAILQQGGTAADATIAVHFAMAVVYPRAGNVGGGGLAVFRQADGTVNSLDYREKAPMAAAHDMYLDSAGQVIEELSTFGHLAAGVPGMVDGMVTMHAKFGRLPWELLLAPAIDLAAKGYKITAAEADRFNTFKAQFTKANAHKIPFVKSTLWVEGDMLVQPALASTLTQIRDKKRAGFYQGPVAQHILQEMKKGGGIIQQADLDAYASKWRTPIVGYYKNNKVIGMPPPSSGGIALLQLLEMVEDYNLKKLGFLSPDAVHVMIEAERRAFHDRALYLGDNDFYEVPMAKLIDSLYLRKQMADFDMAKATSSDSLTGDFTIGMESFETTHTSIVDPFGNAVSVTTTLNSNFGCKVVVEGGGFFLNNEMDDFSAKPGVPNLYGLVGSEANAIAPQKRMLSSMTPTIVEKDGKLWMLLGSPGGSTIITSVFQVLLNVETFGMSLEEAVAAPRFHHQWLPKEVWYEGNVFDDTLITALKNKGHNMIEKGRIGIVKAILVDEKGRLHGVGDSRNPDDAAEGF